MNSPAERYPWHDAPWRAIVERHQRGRLPHALLLTGPAGVGKHAFALRLAAALLCESPDASGNGCGSCRGCTLLANGSHPDYRHLRLLNKGEYAGRTKLTSDATVIRIDQVRELSEALALSAQHGGWKVALIDPADLMMAAAANALLKTLEEPAGNALMMLVATRPARLPATIRSRCQVLSLSAPPADEAITWLAGQGVERPEVQLALADGSPLRALELAGEGADRDRAAAFDAFCAIVAGREDPVAVAGRWSADPDRPLGWLAGWLVDMIRLKSDPGTAVLDNRDLADRMQALVERIDLLQLFARLDDLQQARRLVGTPVNAQLLCEELLLGWRGTRNR
jgi:DNA polymerase-3 subunit delta'